MDLHSALGAAATLIALAFALSTLERYRADGKRHELAWTVSLFLFAAGSAALWAGAALGWGEWSYKAFYLFGAILNVPYLALGTVYLLGSRRFGDRCAAVVSLLAAFAAGLVVAAPLAAPLDPEVLPRGSEVFPPGPRIFAAVGSSLPTLVILGGALWSAARLLRSRRGGAGALPSGVSPGRLAAANLLIAGGTMVLAAGGVSNSVLDAMDSFAISLVVGISLIFGGFLLTGRAPSAPPPVEPWYPPERVGSARPVGPRHPRPRDPSLN